MILIVLNGPPGSGKDTAASFIIKHYNATHVKFSSPLKKIFDPVFRVGASTARKMINEGRDTPQPLLFGKTPRDVQIRFYLDFLVPNFGEDVLGRLMLRELRSNISPVAVASDGKPEDLRPIVHALGRNNVYSLEVSRPGYNWGDHGDYRTAVSDAFDIPTQYIDNKYDTEMYEQQVIRAMDSIGIPKR